METGRSRRGGLLPRAGRGAAALAVAVVAALGACGGSGGDDDAAPTTTAPPSTTVGTVAAGDQPAPVMSGEEVCALLSKDDIEDATDRKVQDPVASGPAQCSYVAVTEEGAQPSLAAAIAVDLAGLDNFDRILRFEGSKEIDDLFDKALLNPSFFTVGAVRGETYVQVQLPNITDEGKLEDIGRELVEKIFEKL